MCLKPLKLVAEENSDF